MELRKMKTLVAIADHGSFSTAARAVNLTQSAVSQQMRELETQIGVTLFDRTCRPPRLTRLGKAYVETARSILARHQDFVDRHCRTGIRGTLVVGAVRSALTTALPAALRALKRSFPELSLRLTNSGRLSADLAEEVAAGTLDAALIVGPPEPAEGLVWKGYAIERFFVVAPRDTPGATDVDLLGAGPYLRFVPHLPGERRIDAEIERKNLRLNAEMELDTFETILLMASAGLGVGIVPELYLRQAANLPVRFVPFGDATFVREVGVIAREDCRKMELVDILWSVLRTQSAPSAASGGDRVA